MCEWIKWEDREPIQGEAALVIFFNRVVGKYWINPGSIIAGPFWYDNVPIAWMPMPELPEEYKELNIISSSAG